MTLTEFLTARLDEDGAVAREVLDSHDPLPPWAPGDFGDSSAWQMGAGEGPSGYISVIIDAARTLAEVAAKRAIVEEAGQFGLWEGGMAFIALCHLASVYADHPDFRAEWAEWAGRS